MKKKFLFPFSLFVAVIIYYGVNNSASRKEENIQTFNTFLKNEKGSIQSYNSTNEELKKSQINANSIRTPSSIKNSEIYKHLPMHKNRVLIGDDSEGLNFEKISFINKINPDWKKLLGEDLLRFQSNDTKVIVKDDFDMIKLEANKARYVQQVVINYILKDGETSSFKALVDSETGLILETWDRTINESSYKKFKKKSIIISN